MATRGAQDRAGHAGTPGALCIPAPAIQASATGRLARHCEGFIMGSQAMKDADLLTLPELILHAVTESAAILELRENGAVLWKATALEDLTNALQDRFKQVAEHPGVQEMVDGIALRGVELEASNGEIIKRVILAVLEVGCGLNVAGLDIINGVNK